MNKRLIKTICCTLFVVICSLFMGTKLVSAKDTENFYFSDFTADYYLSKDQDGISHLKVIEELVAEFPSFEQNKGIKRYIPFVNQEGTNITLSELNESNITVLRNGEPEPIWKISREGDYYAVETGTDDYVTGTQVYTFEYEFEKVVMDFGTFQELYWDTNGNGWPQKFKSVTARLHFEDDLFDKYNGANKCYTGKYNDGGSDCQVYESYDGIGFTTKNLDSYENMTFAVGLEPGTFVVPEPDVSYAAVIATVIIGVICVIILVYAIYKYQKTSQKIREYKGIFTAPQYQPDSEYGLAEMTEVYLGKKHDVKVGLLLQMIVNKNVELHKKGDEGIKTNSKWSLLVKDTNVDSESMIALELLNGGNSVKNGDVIELKARTANSSLISLGKSFDQGILKKIKEDGLVEKDYKIGNSGPLNLIWEAVSAMFWSAFIVGMGFLLLGDFFVGLIAGIGKVLAWKEGAVVTICLMISITFAIMMWMSARKTTIGSITAKGMKASKYMEGLKLYIKMAEADRMKMLQSVKGVDTSPEGIVKLYEKLLPYAAVFGLEESWMDEMKEYCNAKELEEPDYLLTGITASQLSRTMRSSAVYASSAGHTIAGGGSYSSSSSGSTGGGFSGGGGGGGR